MLTFTTPQAKEIVTRNLNLSDNGHGAATLKQLDFLDFPKLEENVKADVEFLKGNELVNVSLPTRVVVILRSIHDADSLIF
jgi:hypothetical protein